MEYPNLCPIVLFLTCEVSKLRDDIVPVLKIPKIWHKFADFLEDSVEDLPNLHLGISTCKGSHLTPAKAKTSRTHLVASNVPAGVSGLPIELAERSIITRMVIMYTVYT